MERDAEEDNEIKIMTVFCHGVEDSPLADWYSLLEIDGCGVAWSPTPAGKVIDNDDEWVAVKKSQHSDLILWLL